MNDRTWLRLMRWGAQGGCHQLAARSFSYHGYQFPLCARCTGLLVGWALALPIALALSVAPLFALLLLVPMALDWGLQALSLCQSTNLRRLITGLLGGCAWMFLFAWVLRLVLSLVLPS